MAFGPATRLVAAVALVTLTAADAWLAPLVAKGNKLFDSATGVEFRMKGMAYFPRPNAGELSTADGTGYDWASDDHEAVWAPHLKILQDLNVNTIRLYSVDPTKSHDKFMCACAEAGIYVLVGMAAPCDGCAVPDLAPPACYPPALYERAQLIYNAFAVYDNTLGFSVGNENNMPSPKDPTGLRMAPCVKALLRDTKAYAASCASSLRQVPIGLDQADLTPRAQWISYYDCLVDDDANTSADWLGFNPYVECDPIKHATYAQADGLQKLMSDYRAANYSRPILFGEFGCNKGVNTVDGFANQRAFNDAKWMNTEKEMMAEVVGGNVFEFNTEVINLIGKKLNGDADPGKYGVGYFSPDNCDHDTIPCTFKPYPEYANLKKAYGTTPASKLTLDDYTPARNQILNCPKTLSTTLPKTPNLVPLSCAATQPVCAGKKANTGKKTKVVDKRVKADGKPVSDQQEEETSSTMSSSGSGTKETITKPSTKPSATSAQGAPSTTTAAPSPTSSATASAAAMAATLLAVAVAAAL